MVSHTINQNHITWLGMPATRELGGSTCSVELEGEWKKEEGGVMADWGFPPSVVLENQEDISDQGQSDSNEKDGSHTNYAYFEVSETLQ